VIRPTTLLRTLLPALLLITSACSSAVRRSGPVSPESPAAIRIYDTQARRWLSFAQFAEALARRDLVFFGEQHDDPATHAAELAVLAALGERRPHVVLSLEMFERDVQPLLDQYLLGTITEENFLAGSRPWNNYASDYRALVELSRVRGWSVVASNVPRRLASAVGRQGLPLLDTLNARDRAFTARENICPKDLYYEKFAETMQGHGAGGGPPTAGNAAEMARMTDRFYEAQCVKDEAMGEAIAAAYRRAPRGTVLLHVNGAFHSDFGLGTAERARRRLPGVSLTVITAIPVPGFDALDGNAQREKADYVIFARRR
jgi:uncharacterized iron-regulated protein